MPDCRWKTFNSCADPDGDGIPEGEFEEEEWQGGTKWEQYLIIGIAIIGAIVIIPPLLRAVRPTPRPAALPPPPQYPPPRFPT